jgi:hypothetical protein
LDALLFCLFACFGHKIELQQDASNVNLILCSQHQNVISGQVLEGEEHIATFLGTKSASVTRGGSFVLCTHVYAFHREISWTQN